MILVSTCLVKIFLLFLLLSEIDCGPLDSPNNGFIDVNETTLSSSAIYNCNTGYIINGTSTRTCQRSGVWSGVEPSCEGMYCSVCVFPFHNNHNVKLTKIDFITVESV